MKRLLLAISLLASCGGSGQSPDCKKWVACWEALPGHAPGGQDSVYGPSGACWTGDTMISANCTSACKNLLMAESLMMGAPTECR